jgi:hypothetical protein
MVRQIKWLLRGDMKWPFGRTDSRLMAVTLVVPASRPSSCFSGRVAGGSIGFGVTSQFCAGQAVIAIANTSVVPSANPGGGGILYAEDGALEYRGSKGLITAIAPAAH